MGCSALSMIELSQFHLWVIDSIIPEQNSMYVMSTQEKSLSTLSIIMFIAQVLLVNIIHI